EPLVEHAIKSIDLVAIALNGVGEFLHCIVAEVIVLSGHGAEIAHLPEQPLDALGAPAQLARQEPAGFLRKIEQYRAGLEQRNRLAAIGRFMIDNRGDAIIRRNDEEMRFELLSLADVHGNDVVGKASLL